MLLTDTKDKRQMVEHFTKISMEFFKWSRIIYHEHIAIYKSFHCGSHYKNYKGTDRIVLMGMIGAKYEFLYVDHVDVGINSRNFDPN